MSTASATRTARQRRSKKAPSKSPSKSDGKRKKPATGAPAEETAPVTGVAKGRPAPPPSDTPRPKPKMRSSPPPVDLEVDPDVLEFIKAIDDYRATHDRPFPTWSEVLYVMRKLGYRKS